MKKGLRSALLTGLVITMFLGNVVHASQENIKIKNVSVESIENIQLSDNLLDKDKVLQIVESALTARVMVENHYTDFDFAAVQNNPSKNIKSLNFFNKKAKLFKEMRKHANISIIDESLDYDFQEVNVVNDTASVKVKEWYRFYINDKNNGLSTSGTEYNITLVKKNKKWLITEICSNDPFDEAYYVTDFNYDLKLKEMTETPIIDQAAIDKVNAKKEMILAQRLAYTNAIYYDGAKAGKYAFDYCNDGSSKTWNTNFPYFSSDCQNFASQSVWAGFGGINTKQAIDGKQLPMMASGPYQWYCTSTGSVDAYSRWTSCHAFASYIENSSASTLGVVGVIYTDAYVASARVGDIFHTPGSSGSYSHACVVDEVKNPDGQQTSNSIYVSEHNVDRQHQTLAYMFGSSAVGCKNIQILMFYY